MNQKLQGIVPPLVTPLLDNNTLDIEGLERLIEHVIQGGVHGIFILGTTGEGPSLSFNLQTEMIIESGRILNKRLPLLVGISHTSIVESIHLTQIAYEAGADAVVSAPPYYFTTSQTELAGFYETLIPQLKLPLYLYNMPGMTKMSFAPSTVKRIAQNDKVIGFKDSSANGTYFQSVMHEMRDRKDFSFFVGPEEMMAEAVMLGADGGVNGGANIFPKLYVDLYNAASAGNMREVRKLQAKVMQISSLIYNVGQYSSSYLMGVKCALSVLGICKNILAQPFSNFKSEQEENISKAIADLKLFHSETQKS
ncbi:dihydrodipicolinate synthase family protein [uncultured Draconibacterium sp.]|uniref:dihydrodipicolinate synthase family protein n=1 Tax=uncultured Draconibacterium sp. TaxID=1573823 RepID=UPI0029C81D68|nr:dihydrodipicolinate synthase family protein [uncultured Draconibacterium sp.]